MLSKFEDDGELNSKFEPGNFKLAVESIKAYQDLANPKLILVNPRKDNSLERIIPRQNSNYIIVRNSPITAMPTNKTFGLQDLNITENNTSLNPLVKLAIKALEFPQEIAQVWQINS